MPVAVLHCWQIKVMSFYTDCHTCRSGSVALVLGSTRLPRECAEYLFCFGASLEAYKIQVYYVHKFYFLVTIMGLQMQSVRQYNTFSPFGLLVIQITLVTMFALKMTQCVCDIRVVLGHAMTVSPAVFG